MKLLAIETATEACSAALLIDGEIREKYTVSPKAHTKLILPMVDELMTEAGLKPAELDVLAFGCGPGSFTGVRIATGMIQGIAFAYDLPVAPISCLAAVAQDFFDHSSENTAFVAMDARMNEIYWAVYRRNHNGFAELIDAESVTSAENIIFPEITGIGIGTGWKNYNQELLTQLGEQVIRFESDHLPRAKAIAKLGFDCFNQGLTVRAEFAVPAYLRDKVAKKESERLLS